MLLVLIKTSMLVPPRFGRSPPAPHVTTSIGVVSPAASLASPHVVHSTTIASTSPVDKTPRDDTLGSISRKCKSADTDILWNFDKDYDFKFLRWMELQKREKCAWRSDVLAFDTTYEAKITKKDAHSTNMDQKLYKLEVESLWNLGNMVSALVMMACSIQSLVRWYTSLNLSWIIICLHVCYALLGCLTLNHVLWVHKR